MQEAKLGPPGMPQEGIGPHGVEGGEPEQLRLRRLREGMYVTEMIRDPDVSPEVAREFLIHEVLFPSEEGKLEMSRWEVNPTLREILRRAGEGEELRRFKTILEKQNANLASSLAQIAQLKTAGKEKEAKAIESDPKFLALMRTRDRTKGIIAMRERSLLFPDEAEEWATLAQEVDAAVSWHEIYLQREKAQSDIDTYADSLFKSNFFIDSAGISSLIALLEQKEYGLAIEQALKAYIDIHLKGGKQEIKILLKEDAPPDEERKPLYEAVRTEVVGKMAEADKDLFVAKRAEVLARHLMETSLLSVWLSVPRNEKGEIDYTEADEEGKTKLRKIGFGRLEGSSPTDLPKLVLFRLKCWTELNKNYPSIAGGMARYLPESLTPTFFHFMQTKEGKEKGKSVFDEWYVEGKPLAGLLKKVPEAAFSSWVYCMWRQNNTRNHLLNFSMGGDKNCIMELENVGFLRAMKKDFDIAMASDPLAREITKINMVACRLIAWSGGENQEILSTNEDMAGERESIHQTCVKSGLLNEAEWNLVLGVTKNRKALTPAEFLANHPVKHLIRTGEPDRLETITKDTISREVAEVQRADRLMRGIAARRSEFEFDGRIDPQKLQRVIREEEAKP